MQYPDTIKAYDESALLQQVAKGDEFAFAQLMQRYASFLGSHIYRLTNNREQTEEIVQDVFMKIWQTRENLAEVKNFQPYLYVISRNQAINALRGIIRERARRQKWEKEAVNTEQVEETDEKDQQLSLMDQAIQLLPPQQKTAWTLSRHNGLKYKEIALEMNLSEETVKKYIRYASQSIVKHVEENVGLFLLGITISLN